MLFGIDFHHNFSPGDKSRALAPYGVRRESERLIARSLPAAVELHQMSTASTLADHPAHELGCGPHCGWTPTARCHTRDKSAAEPGISLSVSICKGVTSTVSIECIGTQL